MRLGILGSTRGTHLLTILEAIQKKRLAASIEIVISNKSDALILQRANAHQLNAQFLNPAGLTREQYDHQVSLVLKQHAVDLVVLIGYMRILSAEFVNAWENKIINVHPSLLPAFAGKMDVDVHAAVLATQLTQTGCTVHYVTAEVDAGPHLLQKCCAVLPGDTVQTLKARVQALEGEALVEAMAKLDFVE